MQFENFPHELMPVIIRESEIEEQQQESTNQEKRTGKLNASTVTYAFKRPQGESPQKTNFWNWVKTIIFKQASPLTGHDKKLEEHSNLFRDKLEKIDQDINLAKQRINQINRKIIELKDKKEDKKVEQSSIEKEISDLNAEKQELLDTLENRKEEWKKAKSGLEEFKQEIEGSEVRKYQWWTMIKLSKNETKVDESFKEFECNYVDYAIGDAINNAQNQIFAANQYTQSALMDYHHPRKQKLINNLNNSIEELEKIKKNNNSLYVIHEINNLLKISRELKSKLEGTEKNNN